jgi:hypothetical protein
MPSQPRGLPIAGAPTPANSQIAAGATGTAASDTGTGTDIEDASLRRSKRRRTEDTKPRDASSGTADEVDAAEMEMDEFEDDEENGLDDGMDDGPRLSGAMVQPIPVPETTPQWLETLERSVKSIVAIRFSQVAAFDTDQAGNSEVCFGFIKCDLKSAPLASSDMGSVFLGKDAV